MKLGAVIVVMLAWVATAHAYAVGPAKPLAELAKAADLVVKTTVIADAPVKDPSFDPFMGFEVREASLKIVSTLKGTPAAKAIKFRYYAVVPNAMHAGYSPQAHKLLVGRTYIVFAMAAGGGVYQQHARSHTMKAEQGVVLAADARPHRGKTVTDAVRAELVLLLKSKSTDDVTFAIRELDELSGGRRLELSDLDRTETLATIRRLVLSPTDDVARAAIEVFGLDSPYFDDAMAPFWLAGMGKGTIAGMSPVTPPVRPTADVATKELLAVATKRPALRALAIRTLGRSKAIPAATLASWTRDPDVDVRRAAVLVTAELADHTALSTGATDPAPEVRRAAAFAIGMSQDAGLMSVLSTLLADPEGKVQQAAAMSLLSFPVDLAAPQMSAALRTDWAPLFVNVLAKRDPAPYLAQLADVIEKRLQPKHWWGGSIPAGESWDLLYAYVKSRPHAELAAGKHDRWLDALERMRWFSSSEPRDLYALYLDRKLTSRAKKFRASAKLSTPGDIEYFFTEAEKHPDHFLR